jgi:hypothetical protein
MSVNRRLRLERLEARQPRGKPWTDPYPVVMRLWDDLQAVVSGRACWRKREPAEPMSEEAKDAFDRLVAEVDMMNRRLSAETPEAG